MVSKCLLSLSWKPFTGLSTLLPAATPTPLETEERDDIDVQPDTPSTDVFARAFARTLEGFLVEEREAKKQKFQEVVDEERV